MAVAILLSGCEDPAPAENEAHKRAHGTARIGSKHHAAKLTEAEVIEIRLSLAEGVTGRELSRQYEVSEQIISGIKNRKIWRHVQ